MKKTLKLALLALLLTQGAQAGVNEQRKALFWGHDDREHIAAPYAAPFDAVGILETKAQSTCTATLVAPDLAVTAAHCFLMDKGKLDNGAWFKAGFHKGEYLARYKVVKQVFSPQFAKGLKYVGEDVYIAPTAAPYDIAWLKLELHDGKAPQPMPMFTGDAKALKAAIKAAGSKVTQAGFAEDHDDVLTAHKGCQLMTLRKNNTFGHRCDTLSGDSGSPIWLTTEHGPLLIGVQSTAPDWFNRSKADNTGVSVLQLPTKP